MTVEVALIISIVSVAFSVFFGLKNYRRADTKEIEERVRENTTINFKLDNIGKDVITIKEEVQDLKRVVQTHGEDIVMLKASYKSEHKRIDEIADRLNIPRVNIDDDGK